MVWLAGSRCIPRTLVELRYSAFSATEGSRRLGRGVCLTGAPAAPDETRPRPIAGPRPDGVEIARCGSPWQPQCVRRWSTFLAGALSAACTEGPECVFVQEAGRVALDVTPQGLAETATGTVTVESTVEGIFVFVLQNTSGPPLRGTFKVPEGASLVGRWYGELKTGSIPTLREGQLVLRANRGSSPHFGIWGLVTRSIELHELMSVEYEGDDCVRRDACAEWSAATMVVTSSLGGTTVRIAPGARAELGRYMLGNGASRAGHRLSEDCVDVFVGYESGYFLQLSLPR